MNDNTAQESPLAITVRYAMERLQYEVMTQHPHADMLAVKLMVVAEMNKQGWGEHMQITDMTLTPNWAHLRAENEKGTAQA